jgi:hypothetical protein
MEKISLKSFVRFLKENSAFASYFKYLEQCYKCNGKGSARVIKARPVNRWVSFGFPWKMTKEGIDFWNEIQYNWQIKNIKDG